MKNSFYYIAKLNQFIFHVKQKHFFFDYIHYICYKAPMENKKLKPRIVRWNKKYSYIYIAPETKKEMKKAAMNMGLTLNVYVAEMFYRYGFEFSQVPKEQRTETIDVAF